MLAIIEYGIFGEGSRISTNQKRENSALLILIGRNLRPYPDNTALYNVVISLKCALDIARKSVLNRQDRILLIPTTTKKLHFLYIVLL